jgi:hypothetical protein
MVSIDGIDTALTTRIQRASPNRSGNWKKALVVQRAASW